MSKSILLESGTNEVEIIEFYVGQQSFGINVAKVRQIIQFDETCLTEIPNSKSEIKGTYSIRGEIIGLIDLAVTLGKEQKEHIERPLILVTEFNNTVTGFLIDGVNRIHRISWDNLSSMDNIFSGESSSSIGTITIDNKEVLILDLEKILSEINPSHSVNANFNAKEISSQSKKNNSEIKLYFAEDSTFIREAMTKNLHDAGFNSLTVFTNGLDAWENLQELKEKTISEGSPINTYINIIVSDIEMPNMDGLTLCKKIKDDNILKTVPVLLFSSLVTDQMRKKAKSVGADDCVAKPDTKILIDLISQLAN